MKQLISDFTLCSRSAVIGCEAWSIHMTTIVDDQSLDRRAETSTAASVWPRLFARRHSRCNHSKHTKSELRAVDTRAPRSLHRRPTSCRSSQGS